MDQHVGPGRKVRRHGVIRRGKTTDAAAHEGARLREGLIDPANTASDVWADTAYRSTTNERFLDKAGKVSRIHHKKPRGKPMPPAVARANATDEPVHSHHRHRPRRSRHHTGQHGLQYEAMVLARPERCACMRWNGIEDATSDNDPREQQGQGRAEPKTSLRHSRNRTLARSEASIRRCPACYTVTGAVYREREGASH